MRAIYFNWLNFHAERILNVELRLQVRCFAGNCVELDTVFAQPCIYFGDRSDSSASSDTFNVNFSVGGY